MRQADFERLFDCHAQPLFAFLVYRTGDRALAEDIAADTFERALRRRRQFNPRRGSEKNWLYAIALNLLRDHLRRADAETRSLERLGEQRSEADSIDGAVADRDLIRRALAVLSPEEREAIALRYGGDLTVPEIAELSGEPLTTIDGRVYRALRKLREELDSREGVPAPTSAPAR
jgi:RNA polymerase sigma factor (sigma-70 family)